MPAALHAVIARAGWQRRFDGLRLLPDAHGGSLYDVTSGRNGLCLTYLCAGTTGFDGPSGLGTPNGTGGF